MTKKYADIENWTLAKLQEELDRIEPIHDELRYQIAKRKENENGMLSGLYTAEQCKRKELHEIMHEHFDAATQYGIPTTADQDHHIIDILEAEGYLDVV